jgi:dephospho-CoA kinase
VKIRGEIKPVIGLVGGVGAGKSTVAEELANLGCMVVNGDAIGHEVLGRKDVIDRVVELWGRQVLVRTADGGRQVDRSALGKVVFENPQELGRLNSLTHPLIRAEIQRQIQAGQRDPSARAIVLDAAVLLEAGWDQLCTHLVSVRAPAQQRQERVARERGWDERSWRQREKMQNPLDSKIGRCYYSIDNSSSVSHLCEAVRELFHGIINGVNHS